MILRPQTPTLWVLLFSLKGSIIPAIWRKVLYTVLLSSLLAGIDVFVCQGFEASSFSTSFA